ncbi:maltase 2-like [Diprion similis]|uniref:maltase 2-like n=1 Tax=Diprion similis TaxID=362088 RepID=UPI001EF88279|nr:maltase 2-like [Diprion similis]
MNTHKSWLFIIGDLGTNFCTPVRYSLLESKIYYKKKEIDMLLKDSTVKVRSSSNHPKTPLPTKIRFPLKNVCIPSEGKTYFSLSNIFLRFRVDAALYNVEFSTLENETRSDKDVDSTNYFYLNHTQTKDQPENYPLVQEWKEHINNYTAAKGNDKVRFICTEGYSDIEYVMKWYDYDVDIPFNFWFIKDGDISKDAVIDTAEDIYNIFINWLDNMLSGKTANWVVRNHDTLSSPKLVSMVNLR